MNEENEEMKTELNTPLKAESNALKADLESSVMQSRSTKMDDMLVDRPQSTAKIPNVLENGGPPINKFLPKNPLTTKVIFNTLLT